MRLLGGKFPKNDLSKSFLIVLFLLCNLILVFSCKEEDRQVEEGVQSPFTEEDIQYFAHLDLEEANNELKDMILPAK